MNSSLFDDAEIAEFKGSAVLIYSGDRTFLDYYRSMFLSLGLTPVTATTSEAAVAILRLVIVAYVVVDAEDGLEQCRQVMRRARETQHHAPVLAISQKDDSEFRHKAMTMGAADCLEHPAPPDHMLHSLLSGHALAKTTLH
ncbi:MAG TPA: response regulator [Terriglobia bacterium]|nr:response regulator [Terriglobia bacterium]